MSRPFKSHPHEKVRPLQIAGEVIIGLSPAADILPRRKMGHWDFDGDEFVFFIAAVILGCIGLYRWYWPLISVTRLGRRGAGRDILGITPALAMAGLALVLVEWADPKYVVGNLDYQLMFAAGGL